MANTCAGLYTNVCMVYTQKAHPGSLSQVLDGPDNWEQDGAAADDVHQVQNVTPREPRPRRRRVLIQNDYRHLSTHLFAACASAGESFAVRRRESVAADVDQHC